MGHYWRVPVDEAVVRVHLPPELPANVVAANAYAGHRGATPERGALARIERTAIPDGFEFRVANLPRVAKSQRVVHLAQRIFGPARPGPAVS